MGMSGLDGAARSQEWQIIESEVVQNLREPKMVPCAICGESVPLMRLVKQDGKLICQNCYNKLHTSKRASEETARARKKHTSGVMHADKKRLDEIEARLKALEEKVKKKL
jgi:uncharacterized Zn finger protein (UPF0148 family)